MFSAKAGKVRYFCVGKISISGSCHDLSPNGIKAAGKGFSKLHLDQEPGILLMSVP